MEIEHKPETEGKLRRRSMERKDLMFKKRSYTEEEYDAILDPLLQSARGGTDESTTILLMISTGIPAGCVTIPIIVQGVGLLNFVAISIFLGVYTLMVCQAYTMAITRTNVFSLSQLVKIQLGQGYKYFFDLAMYLYMNGQLVVNYKLSAKYVYSVLHHLDIEWLNEDEWMVLIAIVTYSALLPKNLSGLSFASYVGALALLYLAVYLVINYFLLEHGKGEINWYTTSYSVQAGAFGNMIYQYFFMNNIDSGYKELDKRSHVKAIKVFNYVTLIFFFFFTIVGVFGYLTFLDDVMPTVVNNDDYLSIGGRLAMFVFVNISTMIGFFVTKIMAMDYACDWGCIPENWSDAFNYVYSLVMVVIFVVVAIVTPNIVGFINIIAGLLGCVIFSVTPPLLAYVETSNSMLYNLVFIVLSLFVTQFGVLSSYSAVIEYAGLN